MIRVRKVFPGLLLGGLGLAFGLLSWTLPAFGQKAGPGPPPSREEMPLRISAARLEADQKQRLIAFLGQVKAEHGDSVLYADQLLIHYEPSPPAPTGPAPSASDRGLSPLGDLGGGRLKRLEARGNVRIVQGDRVATAEEAVYYPAQEELILQGHPQVWRGENHLKGSRIIVNLKTKIVRVESSPRERVEAYLYQSPATLREKRVKSPPPAVPPPTVPERRQP